MPTTRLLLPLAAAISLAFPAPATEPDPDEAALRELKEVLWPKAYFDQNTDLLDRILADEFRLIDGSGAWSNKAEELEWVAGNKPAYDSLVFEIRRLEIFDGDAAVVAGTGTVHGSDQGGPYVAEYQSTNVLVKRNGEWKAVASHFSGFERK
jgi:hypothetical protein